MKRDIKYVLAGALLCSLMLTGCSTQNTETGGRTHVEKISGTDNTTFEPYNLDFPAKMTEDLYERKVTVVTKIPTDAGIVKCREIIEEGLETDKDGVSEDPKKKHTGIFYPRIKSDAIDVTVLSNTDIHGSGNNKFLDFNVEIPEEDTGILIEYDYKIKLFDGFGTEIGTQHGDMYAEGNVHTTVPLINAKDVAKCDMTVTCFAVSEKRVMPTSVVDCFEDAYMLNGNAGILLTGGSKTMCAPGVILKYDSGRVVFDTFSCLPVEDGKSYLIKYHPLPNEGENLVDVYIYFEDKTEGYVPPDVSDTPGNVRYNHARYAEAHIS